MTEPIEMTDQEFTSRVKVSIRQSSVWLQLACMSLGFAALFVGLATHNIFWGGAVFFGGLSFIATLGSFCWGVSSDLIPIHMYLRKMSAKQ